MNDNRPPATSRPRPTLPERRFASLEDRIQQMVGLHFDPRWGAPYWLEKRAQLPFDPVREIRTRGDLRMLPPVSRKELATRPVYDFLPRKLRQDPALLLLSETGGTTGPPARTLFHEGDFYEAFVAPFLAAAGIMQFPTGTDWLFIGPSGPHPIGKAARHCALDTGSMEPFMVDFDPRWARRLSGFALDRYREHIVRQAMDVLLTQRIGVLFATPPVLAALGRTAPLELRLQIAGIHTGGMAPDPAFWARLTNDWFPRAVVLSGYGNSLAGMCPQVSFDPHTPPAYFPLGDRLLLEVPDPGSDGRGRVCFHRLDESCLLPNMLERDEAAIVPPPAALAAAGFLQPGLQDPRPSGTAENCAQGLY